MTENDGVFSQRCAMDVSKLQEAVAELKAEAQECLRLAADIEVRIRKATNGSASVPSGKVLVLRSRKKKSLLGHALDLIREDGGETHISEIFPKVGERAGRAVARASVEAALIRDMNSDKPSVRRTRPGTYALI
jgi:hypothetical protein